MTIRWNRFYLWWFAHPSVDMTIWCYILWYDWNFIDLVLQMWNLDDENMTEWHPWKSYVDVKYWILMLVALSIIYLCILCNVDWIIEGSMVQFIINRKYACNDVLTLSACCWISLTHVCIHWYWWRKSRRWWWNVWWWNCWYMAEFTIIFVLAI